jgi:hypothetical protein
MRTLWLALIVSAGLTLPAAAQSVSQGAASWGRGTGLAVSPGLSLANDDTRVTFGGAALWELTAHLAVEGAGRWMDRGAQADAYAGELSALIGLGGTRDTAVPYAVLGVGLHRRTFDVHDTTVLDDIPEFYRRRLGGSGGVLGVRRSFTDPTLVAGAGVDIALSRTVVLRPDVRVLLVVNGGRHHAVTLATLNLGYRFEHKPVTPARR